MTSSRNAYATKKGTQSRALVEKLISSSEYKGLPDEKKADAISYAYDLADYQAKQALIPGYKKTTWEQTAVDLYSDYKVPSVTYIKAKALATDVKSIKDESGESIANSKGLQIMEALYASGLLNSLTKEQRTALLDAVGVGKTIVDYSEKTVQLKLKNMRK